MEPVAANYEKDLAAKGFKPDEIEGRLSFIGERVGFWSAKAKEQGIKSPYQQ